MQSQSSSSSEVFRLTFHYVNGQRQTFDIQPSVERGITLQDVRLSFRRFLNENWWVVNTPQQSFFINPANVLSVEVYPPTLSLEGDGVLTARLAGEIMG